jgi:hypothetical protein
MFVRKIKIFCNECQKESVNTVPVLSEHDQVNMEGLTCANISHDHGRPGLTRMNVKLVEILPVEEWGHTVRHGQDKRAVMNDLGIKTEKQVDTSAYEASLTARAAEIEAERASFTPEQIALAKRATSISLSAYSRPDGKPQTKIASDDPV